MNEIWMSIAGYEDKYEISNNGDVMSLNYAGTGKKRKLKKIITKTGYYIVNLSKGKSQKMHHIHRLIAKAFIPNPNNLPIVDHIDTNPLNNDIQNLRWTTVKGNVNNPISREKRVASIRKRFLGKTGMDASRHRSTIQLDKDGCIIKKWNCISDAWRETGVRTDTIVRCCQGKYVHGGGYIWVYGDEYNIKEVGKRLLEYRKLRSPILQLTTDYKLIKEWNSVEDIRDNLNINTHSVRSCCRMERATSHGFVWRYKYSGSSEERREIEIMLDRNKKYL